MPNLRQAMMGAAGAVEGGYSLWSWGRNNNGQLGQNSQIDSSSPTQVGETAGWAVIRESGSGGRGVKDSGALFVWGRGNDGLLGVGTTISYSSPVQVGSLTDWASVGGRGGSSGTSGIKTDGTIWA